MRIKQRIRHVLIRLDQPPDFFLNAGSQIQEGLRRIRSTNANHGASYASPAAAFAAQSGPSHLPPFVWRIPGERLGKWSGNVTKDSWLPGLLRPIRAH